MPRPNKTKQLTEFPRPVIYMPAGWTKHNLPAAEISVEDFEAMRLVDGEGCNLDEAARRMHCSRSTVGRILERARRIVAQALAAQAPICIDAGNDSNFSISPGAITPAGALAAAVDTDTRDGSIAGVFGRAPYFALFEDNKNAGVSFIPNPGRDVMHGAANAAVRCLHLAGVSRVAAARFGSDALHALAEARIEPLLVSRISLVEFQKRFFKETAGNRECGASRTAPAPQSEKLCFP